MEIKQLTRQVKQAFKLASNLNATEYLKFQSNVEALKAYYFRQNNRPKKLKLKERNLKFRDFLINLPKEN